MDGSEPVQWMIALQLRRERLTPAPVQTAGGRWVPVTQTKVPTTYARACVCRACGIKSCMLSDASRALEQQHSVVCVSNVKGPFS